MGRAPCCEKMGLKKGAWTPKEDHILITYIQRQGHPNWRTLPRQAGLLRCGKSCRLRWMNYLRPGIKRGNFSEEEEETIIRLHQLMGNRWSAIAARLPGRTDNELKNVWHSKLKKRIKQDPPDPEYYLNEKPDDDEEEEEYSLSPTTQPAPDCVQYSPQRSNSSNVSSITESSFHAIGGQSEDRKNIITITSTLNQSTIVDRGLWSGDEMDMAFWEESTHDHISADHDGCHNQVHGDDKNNWQLSSSCHQSDGIDFWYNLFAWSSDGSTELLP